MVNALYFISGLVVGGIIAVVVWLISHWAAIERNFINAIKQDRRAKP